MSLIAELNKSQLTVAGLSRAVEASKPTPYLAGEGIALTRVDGVGTTIGVQPDLLASQTFRIVQNTGAVSGQTGKFKGKTFRANPDESSSAAVAEGDGGSFASTDDAQIWDAFRLKKPIYLSMLLGSTAVASTGMPRQTPIYLAFIGVPFLVRLTQNGGSAGTSSTQCSFTYDVYAWSDSGKVDKLNSSVVALTGTGLRAETGVYIAATYGIAFYDTDGSIKLICAFEQQDTAQGCEA